jgi:hypothetical protein
VVDIDVEKNNPLPRLGRGHAPQHDVVDAKSRPIRKRVVIPPEGLNAILAFLRDHPRPSPSPAAQVA